MYKIVKRTVVSNSHRLELPYESKCKNMHGHNHVITVEIEGPVLNAEGMLIDFKRIDEVVNQLDHCCLNDVLPHNPTAENIAFWVANQIDFAITKEWKGLTIQPSPVKVTVEEVEGNTAIWENR